MARQNLNYGTIANDGTGDNLRTASIKTNNNFIDLYGNMYNHTSTQWSKSVVSTTIPNGAVFDLFTILTNADKVATGTVSRDEYSIVNGGIIIPYIGRPYEGQRLHHFIRVNFNFLTGNTQYLTCSLRRAIDDTIIGSSIPIYRNNSTGGIQVIFETYTNSSADPFVTGGFYVSIENVSGTTIDVSNGTGVLIQTFYERPTNFI